MLALPTLKNEQPNYDNKFTQQANQDQAIPVTNINSLNSFNENNGNINNLPVNNLQSLSPNQNQTMIGQAVISTTNNNLSTNTNQTTSNCQKPNPILTKFSNKSNLKDLNKLEMMEIKQSVQSIQQQNLQQKLNLNLKRSPVESPISLMEMQHSPHCHSESSSTKSSISPGTSLSSSPTHYSAGYSNVHMLRNSILNEPTISINHSQTSTIPLTNLSNFLTNPSNLNNLDDGRPIAIVQGKKNRHNLNEDEEDEQISSVKKFCVSNGNLSSNDQLQNQVAQIETASSSPNNPSPVQSSANNNNANDFRYLMQGHSFNCALNNSNQLGNNLQTNLACNNQQGNQNQHTDNANLFSTAYCNTHEDCKSTQATDFRSCGQRHPDSGPDFRYVI